MTTFDQLCERWLVTAKERLQLARYLAFLRWSRQQEVKQFSRQLERL